MNETGRRVRDQYADTGGFRDLPSKRLYVFERAEVPKRLRRWSPAR